ncbi:hypothetical protein GCM10010302_20310 [Streptomyces polychromogenes]|uniref:Uncharacterized protein n=1 Tax=Streptomyces polychromogenes TaxID=67342 RepID=A0ABP3EWQ3_9ACTN
MGPGVRRAHSAQLGAELVGDPGQQLGGAVEGEEGEGEEEGGLASGRVHRLRHEPILRAPDCVRVARG